MVSAPQPHFDPFDQLPARPLAHQFSPDSVTPAPLAPIQPLVRLTFENVAVFEPVRDQFWDLGVRFEGAIALQPSNPAFSHDTEAVALLPVAGRSNVMAYFRSPRKQISASLTGSRQVRVVAYDCNNAVLMQQSVGDPQYVRSHAKHNTKFPRHEMTLKGEGIAKVMIDSDAPFLLNSLAYS